MSPLSDLVIEAHGGLPRRGNSNSSRPSLVRGLLWGHKGQPHTLERTSVTVGLKS